MRGFHNSAFDPQTLVLLEAVFDEAWLTLMSVGNKTVKPDELARAVVFIDTLHPVHEGRLFRWGYDPAQAPFTAAPARTGSLPPVSIRRMFKPPRAGAIAPLPDAADGRLAVTPPAERCDQRRVRVAVGFVRRGCNRLRRYHQPLRRGQCHRRNGRCLLVMGNEGAGWIQRWPDRHA